MQQTALIITAILFREGKTAKHFFACKAPARIFWEAWCWCKYPR